MRVIYIQLLFVLASLNAGLIILTALAYACMSAFIPKYLYNFFLKDNSHVIQGKGNDKLSDLCVGYKPLIFIQCTLTSSLHFILIKIWDRQI